MKKIKDHRMKAGKMVKPTFKAKESKIKKGCTHNASPRPNA